MRTVTAVVGLVLVVAVSVGQPPADGSRYGVRRLEKQFDQSAPTPALQSVVTLISTDRLDYLAAHLLDPAFVDTRVAERALRVEGDVEREFRRLRDAQRQDPSLPGSARLPDDPTQFALRVRAEATARGFRQLVADIRATLADNPDHVAELRRFLRSGQVLEAGDVASFALKDVKDRGVYFKKTAAGWHIEDRRTDSPEKK